MLILYSNAGKQVSKRNLLLLLLLGTFLCSAAQLGGLSIGTGLIIRDATTKGSGLIKGVAAKSKKKNLAQTYLSIEVNNGDTLYVMRVPSPKINSEALSYITRVQNQLEKAKGDYLNNDAVDLKNIETLIQGIQDKDKDWIVDYYWKEYRIYYYYEKKRNEAWAQKVQREKEIQDSIRNAPYEAERIKRERAQALLDSIEAAVNARKQFIADSIERVENRYVSHDEQQASKAHVNHGIEKNNKEDYQGAIEAYLQAIALYPKNADAYYRRGMTKHILQDYQGAIADYTKAIALGIKCTDTVYFYRGSARSMHVDTLEEHNGYTDDYDKAIDINPNYALAYYFRATAKYLRADYQDAIADLTKVIALNPKNAEVYITRGKIKNDLEDYYGAIADYTKAITLDTKNISAYFYRGNAKIDLKDYQGAIADYTQAIVLDPKDAGAYNNRGIAKNRLKNYTGAIADYTKAIALDPNDGSRYYNRGLAKIKAGNRKGGCLDFSKAGELGYEEAYDLIGEYCQ